MNVPLDNSRRSSRDAPLTELASALLTELGEVALQHAAEGEQLRRAPPAVAAAFLRLDVYRLLLPRDLGGSELGPIEYLRLIERLARIDASIAWLFAIGAGSGLYGGYLLRCDPSERV